MTRTAAIQRPTDRGGSSRHWPPRFDILVALSLVSLLIASTMNGLSFEWGVLGREITIHPDQAVLAFALPLLGLGCILGHFRFQMIPFDWVVLGVFVTNLVSSVLSSRSRNAGLQAAVLLGAYVAMYFVTRQILANRAAWLAAASNWVLGLGIAQAAYSLIAVLGFAFGYALGGLKIGHLTQASVATKGTFWESNILGAYLSLIAVFLTVRYVLTPEGKRGGTYLWGLFITSLALPLAMTRAAGMAFALGVSATGLIIWIYRSDFVGLSKRAGRIVVVLGCAALLTVTAMDDLISSLSSYPNLLVERWVPISLMPSREEAPTRPNATVAGGAAVPPAQSGAAVPPAERQPAAPAPVIEAAVTRASRSSAEGRVYAWLRALDGWRERPLLGHGTLAGVDVIKEGWWYSSLVQALYDTGLLGFSVLLWVHVGAVVYPVRTWFRTRRSPTSANLLAYGAGNAVLFFTSQFSNSYFLGFSWVFLGLSIGAVAACRSRDVT